MQHWHHALGAHRSPPARSKPHGTFSKFGRVGRGACGGVCPLTCRVPRPGTWRTVGSLPPGPLS
eukprot:3051912-Prymnesium_polylepis.1